ncbi:RICIN domain-containing protein [Leeia sp.]|uniref:RICIN domain-containing protein n=1 Tax=Leeia sp. TaxID=2884678 RepID=UPI0035AFF83F
MNRIRKPFIAAMIVLASATAMADTFQSRWEEVTEPLTVNGNSQFTIEDTGEGFIRIKEKFSNNYLNIETGPLKSTNIAPGWHSAQWKMIQTGDGWVRLQNRWKPNQYLHVETGSAKAGPIESGWFSAQWKIIK